MTIRTIEFKKTLFLTLLCINSFSFCMNQSEYNSVPNYDVFFTKKIILKGSFNNLTCNRASLFLSYNNNVTLSKTPLFAISSTENVLYSINPANIDTHQQDSDGNWHIKTIIQQYCTLTQSTDHIITFTDNALSQWLSTAHKNYTISKNPYYMLDQYTLAQIFISSPIFAECTSVLPQKEYIDFLRKKIIQSLLISKDHSDLLLSTSKKMTLKIKKDPNIFSNSIIIRGISNRLTYDHHSLYFGYSALHMQYITPPFFVIKSDKGTAYSFKPQNIDEHQQNSNGDWRIKTIIAKYPKTPPPSDLTLQTQIPILSTILTTFEEDRQSFKKSVYTLDQWTQAKVCTSGSILAKCTTTFSPTEYIHLLRSVATQNILVSKHEKDIIVKHP